MDCSCLLQSKQVLKGENERRRGKEKKNFTGEVKVIEKDNVGNYIPIKV
jgi:hypothetical protein